MMIYILAFVIGCCLGSFIHVIISRKDWYKGRSRCDSCGYTLKWYDLIPVISFLYLRGRCRCCKEKIGLSHIMSELFMGAAFLCSFHVFYTQGTGSGMVCLISLFFIALAAIEDYKEQMVYSWILNGGLIASSAAAITYHLSIGQVTETVLLTVSVLLMKGFMFLLSRVLHERIGEGDFDVMIIIFIMSGIAGMIYSLTLACVIGCLIYLPPIILKKREKSTPLPFVPLLLAGTICYMLI